MIVGKNGGFCLGVLQSLAKVQEECRQSEGQGVLKALVYRESLGNDYWYVFCPASP